MKTYSYKCGSCGVTHFAIEMEQREINIPHPGKEYGFVYIISGGNGLYKIGKTKDVAARMRAIRTANPTAEMLHYFETTDCTFMEAVMQAAYEDKLVRGEWFALTPEDVAYFCAYPSMLWDKT